MDRTQQRFERFAALRAAYPDSDYDEIMLRIHDEERDEDEAAEARRHWGPEGYDTEMYDEPPGVQW